ncbi:hypothetical protein GCM10009856_07200 [Mycolicibacterium llatzerense]
MIATVVVLVVVAGAVVTYNRVVTNPRSVQSEIASNAGRSSAAPAPGSATGTYAPDPLPRLPTAEEIEQITLLVVNPVSVPYTVAAPDTKTTPPNCALADHPTSKSAWGTTQSEAGQLFTDGTYTTYSNTVGVDLAVFATAADATASLAKITDSVKSCVGRYTTQSGANVTASSVLSVHESPNAISWADNTLDQERPWICSMAYKVESNLASSSVICGVAETDSPAKLVDLTLNKATGRA